MKILALVFMIFATLTVWTAFFPAPPTFYAISEWRKTGTLKRDWIDTSNLPRYVYASVLASEDANFCRHNGVEWGAMWDAVRGKRPGGGSTISQQMVKNLYLWHGTSKFSKILRKGMEVPLTLFVELLYPKERILEVYLNIIEFDTSVFGIEEAAKHHFNKPASALTPREMAMLTAVLPNPKTYSVVPLDNYVARRSRQIENETLYIMQKNLDDCLR